MNIKNKLIRATAGKNFFFAMVLLVRMKQVMNKNVSNAGRKRERRIICIGWRFGDLKKDNYGAFGYS